MHYLERVGLRCPLIVQIVRVLLVLGLNECFVPLVYEKLLLNIICRVRLLLQGSILWVGILIWMIFLNIGWVLGVSWVHIPLRSVSYIPLKFQHDFVGVCFRHGLNLPVLFVDMRLLLPMLLVILLLGWNS